MRPLKKAKQMIKKGEAGCVIIKDNEMIRSLNGRGVSPLITIYENEPQVMQDSYIIDKIIGKAAAMIIMLGGAKKVYGEIMSVSGYDFLQEQGCTVDYGQKVEQIVNRSGDGMCPLEKSILNIEDPEKAYQQLKRTLNRLKSSEKK